MTKPTFVLVPGAGGNPWYWHLVVDRLQAAEYDAIAVDIPGDDESADLPDYVDAVVTAADGRDDVVLVAQSLGGFPAVLACHRVAVSRLVLVNAMTPAPGETPGEWWGNTGQREARKAFDREQGRDPEAEFDVVVSFLHDLPPELMTESEQHARVQADRPFGTPADFTTWPDVPTHVVIGRDDRIFPVAFQQRLAQERVGVVGDVVPGGHLVALSYPDELVRQLVSYLAE
jgi:pimeloyl-ACP methyl ester carboxylesterase